MIQEMRDPLCDIIDDVLDKCNSRDAHDLLFRFSYIVLSRLYPDFVNTKIAFSLGDLESLRQKHRGKKSNEVFLEVGKGTNSRRDLLMNLYQAIQENSDLDGVAELIYGLWGTLEREGYAQPVISETFIEALSEDA